MDRKIQVKGNGSRCVHEGSVKENNVQGFTLTANTDEKKQKNFDVNINKVS